MNSVLFTHICFFRLYVCMYQLSISCAFEYFYRNFRYDTMCIINHIYTGSNFDLRMKVNFKQLKVPVSDYLPAQTFWFLHLEVIVRKRNKIQKQTTLTFMYTHSLHVFNKACATLWLSKRYIQLLATSGAFYGISQADVQERLMIDFNFLHFSCFRFDSWSQYFGRNCICMLYNVLKCSGYNEKNSKALASA